MKFGLEKCAVAHFVNGRLSGHNSGVMVEKHYQLSGTGSSLQVLGCR